MNPFLEKKRKVEGPELGAGLEQAQVQALAPEETPEEMPMEAEKARPGWHGLLDLAPGLALAIGHAAGGGQGSPETRAQMNSFMRQAQENESADQRRVAASRAKAREYNNALAQRRQEQARQKSQDTLAAEDRSRRIGKEDAEAAQAAQDRDPASPKNVTLQKAIAETYPAQWAKLTPEQQSVITTQNYAEVLGLPIKEEDRARASRRAMEEERAKQKAEFDYATPGGGVGGSDYLAWLAATRGTGPAPAPAGQPVPGGEGTVPPGPAAPMADDPLILDLSDVYGGKDKIPPGMLARARGVLTGSRAGLGTKEMAQAHQKLIEEAAQDQKETLTRERQTRQDEAAAKKEERQQDASYSQQRSIRNIDKVKSRIIALKAAIAKYRSKANPKGDLPGSGLTGNLPQWAQTPEGRQMKRLINELLDTRIREATGASASEGEVKRFGEMAGIGLWDTDEDLIAGIENAEGILAQQEAFLNGAFKDASIRFQDRMAEQETKAAPDYTKLKGYKPPNAP